MMSEQSRHKIYVCQYQKFWSSYLATLTNNYITVWRVSKKAEGIDVALIKGGCSLLMLSFFNTECRNVKKILRILGTKKILGCLTLDFDTLKRHHIQIGQEKWTALTLESLCD